MPQHLLNHPNVRSVVKQMRCKRMSNELRSNLYACLQTNPRNYIPNRCGADLMEFLYHGE